MKSSNVVIHEFCNEMSRVISSLDWIRSQSWMQNTYGQSGALENEILFLRVLANQTLSEAKKHLLDEKTPCILPYLQEKSALIKFKFCSLLQRFHNCPLLDGIIDESNLFCRFHCCKEDNAQTNLIPKT